MDPLQHHSVSSMFHHTFKDAPPVAYHSDDFNSVHNFMKIMGSKNADKLFDDAEAILSSKFAPTGASENNHEDVTKCNRNLEERRPGLGLKRARFSLKPDKGMPSVSLEPTLDIDKLQDPEEFFSAYYKLEYAKEIIERQAGGNTTRQHEYNPSANQRRRRPSLFGRRASYKHKYSSAILENDDTVMASEDSSQQENHSPLKFVSQEHDVEMQERELGGSVSNYENAVDGLLDELLSRDIENLDGDEALSMLQEHLQIKSVDLDEYLFDPSEVGNIDLIDLEEEMPVNRKALSDIQNVVSGISEKNPVNHEQVAKNKNHASTSSTPSKRPSAESSLSEKGKSSSKPFDLPFSATDPDLSVAESRTRKYLTGQPDNLFRSNETSFSGKLKSRVEDEAKKPACATSGSKQVMPGDSCSEKSANFNTISTDIHSRTSDSHDGLVGMNECNNVGEILHEAVSSVQPDIGNDILSRGTAVQAHGSSRLENNVENIQQIASSTQPDANIDDSTNKNFKIIQSHQEPFVAEDHIMDGHTTNAESGLKQQNEKHPEIPLKDGRKAGRARRLKKRKSLSRRQSLAAAGTFWNSGVRRSNRIKMRPLEYWKGERFLFGRVHESLTTVIGVKCVSSPSPGGKEPKFRVISYVSDEHKDRVDLAALH